MPAGIRVRGVENPQDFGMINADGMELNTDCADDADTHGYVKIRAIRVIRIINRDAVAFSYVATSLAELCALCGAFICGLLSNKFNLFDAFI